MSPRRASSPAAWSSSPARARAWGARSRSRCAAHGATVALLGRKLAKLEATYDAIETAGGAQPALIPLDLAGAATPEYDALNQLLRRDLKRLARASPTARAISCRSGRSPTRRWRSGWSSCA